jgi:hypothetical protein
MFSIELCEQSLVVDSSRSLHTDLCPWAVEALRKQSKPIEGFAKRSGMDGTYHFSFNPYFLDGASKDDGLELSYQELKDLHAEIVCKYLIAQAK